MNYSTLPVIPSITITSKPVFFGVTMLNLVLAVCSTFGGSFGGEAPKEQVTINYRVEKQEIDGTVFFKVVGYHPTGGVVFAPPLYMRNPPMEWAVPNYYP
jgi:hypothetical protein